MTARRSTGPRGGPLSDVDELSTLIRHQLGPWLDEPGDPERITLAAEFLQHIAREVEPEALVLCLFRGISVPLAVKLAGLLKREWEEGQVMEVKRIGNETRSAIALGDGREHRWLVVPETLGGQIRRGVFVSLVERAIHGLMSDGLPPARGSWTTISEVGPDGIVRVPIHDGAPAGGGTIDNREMEELLPAEGLDHSGIRAGDRVRRFGRIYYEIQRAGAAANLESRFKTEIEPLASFGEVIAGQEAAKARLAALALGIVRRDIRCGLVVYSGLAGLGKSHMSRLWPRYLRHVIEAEWRAGRAKDVKGVAVLETSISDIRVSLYGGSAANIVGFWRSAREMAARGWLVVWVLDEAEGLFPSRAGVVHYELSDTTTTVDAELAESSRPENAGVVQLLVTNLPNMDRALMDRAEEIRFVPLRAEERIDLVSKKLVARGYARERAGEVARRFVARTLAENDENLVFTAIGRQSYSRPVFGHEVTTPRNLTSWSEGIPLGPGEHRPPEGIVSDMLDRYTDHVEAVRARVDPASLGEYVVLGDEPVAITHIRRPAPRFREHRYLRLAV